MKKMLSILLAMFFLVVTLAACSETPVPEETPPPIGAERFPSETTPVEYEEPSPDDYAGNDAENDGYDYGSDEYELCYCGEHYVHEDLRQAPPPMNIHAIFAPWQGPDGVFPKEEHEANVAEFVRDFENVHTVTYIQWETDWHSTLVLWPDVPLRDFSFVSLDVAGHEWTDDGRLIINTREVIHTIDELLPTDAVVLNVAFAHYMLPHGAIIFTDEQGVRQRMFIWEDMRGGSFPLFNLGAAHEPPA